MAGRTAQDPNSLEPLVDKIREHERLLRKLLQPTGTSLANLLQQVQDAVANIGSAVTAYLAGGFSTGSMNATGNVTANGFLTGNAGVTSVGAAALNVTTLPGGRSTMWIHDASGRMGQTTSSIRFKTDIEEVPYTPDQFLAVMPAMFVYIGQKDIRDNPDNAYYDPDYVPELEPGMIAEWLLEQGLAMYVQFDEEGLPKNIDYPTFGSHAALVIGRDHERRITELEKRL